MKYTGTQTPNDDPYRNRSEPHVLVGVLGEMRLGRFTIYLNALNLTNIRQMQFDLLLRPRVGAGGNPITDAWAPLAGRTLNIGFKIP